MTNGHRIVVIQSAGQQQVGLRFPDGATHPLPHRREALERPPSGGRSSRRPVARCSNTAATSLLLGVPERTAMDLMGWSHSAMAKRYQHVTAAIRADVAERVGALLWTANETTSETATGPGPDRHAT